MFRPLNYLPLILLATLASPALVCAGENLPQNVTFKNKPAFDALVSRSLSENWRELPIGQRVANFGYAMRGTKYEAYTLEIDDHIESPSANFSGQDCWTFFEIALGLARMIEVPRKIYAPQDLLNEIEWTRYRGGSCSGRYLERIHYLAEWWYDNEARGNILNMTARVGPTIPLTDRKIQEMTVLWKSYRYLWNDPSLLPQMAQIERREEQLPFNYIPKSKVGGVESKIQSGDIIGIVTNQTGGHCSHVGLAYKTEDGVCHFLHASRNYHKVTLDDRLSSYLANFKYHAGVIIARPLPRSSKVTDVSAYKKRLAELVK
ncbi:MAG: DUF1460 domain-containing protein [Verrucomicrobia bacterium]|nr:DUF1460 domain-containing protein [Verrucomicrobiota bacterium]